jgi:hypothetical protein
MIYVLLIRIRNGHGLYGRQSAVKSLQVFLYAVTPFSDCNGTLSDVKQGGEDLWGLQVSQAGMTAALTARRPGEDI